MLGASLISCSHRPGQLGPQRAAGLLLLLLLLAFLLTGCGGPSGPPPNILLISIDTLNRSALRAFDEEARPLRHLDAFAATSARFSNAHSTASWTLPAHASLMTGRYADRHGAVARGLGLAEGIPTLAQHLKGRGYETVAITDGGYVHRRLGFSAGFDRYDDWSAESEQTDAAAGDTEADEAAAAAETDAAASATQIDEVPDDAETDDATAATGASDESIWRPRTDAEGTEGALFQRGIAYLKQREPDDPPFFLFLHTYGVHDYFYAQPWAKARLPEFDDPEMVAYLQCLVGERECSTEEWARLADLYRAEIQNLDEELGRLLDVVEATSGETVVVLLSDHGEGFDPLRGRIHHGGRLHEDLVRVPLLVAGPGIVARRVEASVSLVDVMPTLLELVGSGGADSVPPLPVDSIDGRSFAAELVGEARPSPAADRPLFAHEHFHRWEEGRRLDVSGGSDEALAVAVIGGDLWYIDATEGEELYRMTDDGRQSHNLADAAEIAAAFQELARARRTTAAGIEVVLDGELEEQLRALGYIR